MIGARYQKVYCRIWTGQSFRAWSDDARVLAIYLLTCPHRTTEGLYRLPLPLAHYELGWPSARVAEALRELQVAEFVEHDPAADLVWLVKALEWDGPVGANQIKGAVRALAEVPASPLRRRYLDRAREDCPALAEAIEADLEWQNDPEPTPPNPPPETSEPPSKGLRAVDNTRSKPQAHSQAQAHHPSPSPAPPTTAPRSTQEGPHAEPGVGGGEADDEDPPASLARRCHEAMGYRRGPVNADSHAAIATARNRGWTDDQVLAAAAEAAARLDVRSPGGWWRSKITSSLPPAEPDEFDATPIEPVQTVEYQRVHPDDCPGGCSREGWVDLPDGGVAPCTGQPIEASA